MRYRAEIDGLRAVAVVPVILFHAGFEIFGGGYIGVDVFFVISGYLITSIIVMEKEAGMFSLANFYERRARRILPALFFVMAVSTPFAWGWLSPEELEDYSQSLAAVATFSSNILFWLESGYFDTATELKPLLHTWSLAVEEQFYVLFPLFLIVTWSFGTKRIVVILAIIALASLGIAQWGSINKPTATFYLLPTRGWELLIGVFVAFYLNARKEEIKSSQSLSLIGVAMIGFSVFAFDENTPFPSLYALIPTFGTALIILFTTPETHVYRLLGNKFVVGIGLISYSAYLWHQPLFAFSRHRSLTEPSELLMFGLALLALILAYFSWRFVEYPFRRTSTFNRKHIFVLGTSVSTVFVLLGLGGSLGDRVQTKIDFGSKTLEIPMKFRGIVRDGIECSRPKIPSGVCRLKGSRNPDKGAVSLFVVGDSHARVLTEAVAIDNSAYTEFFDLTAGGCPFLIGLNRYIRNEPSACNSEYQKSRIAFIKNHGKKRKIVILAARWAQYLHVKGFDNEVGGVELKKIMMATARGVPDGQRRQEFLDALILTIDEVSKIADRVIVVLPNHTNGWNVVERAKLLQQSNLSFEELENKLAIPYDAVEKRVREVNEYLHRLSLVNPKVSLIDPRIYTCDSQQQKCYGFRNGKFLFRDNSHLTLDVNKKIVTRIYSIIR
jgi:peptidoglycan/LPS O-acetylase OafA/YrhL